MPDFEFNCDDCGQLWSLKVQRAGAHYCKPCIERRRKDGTGPIQQARASGTLGASSGGGSSSTATAARPSVPTQSAEDLSDLASRLKAKYDVVGSDDDSDDSDDSNDSSDSSDSSMSNNSSTTDSSMDDSSSGSVQTTEAIGESI